MEKTEADTIRRSTNGDWEDLSVEYFLEHVPDRYKTLCKYIHHVDTWQREDKEGKYWRVQGYILTKDFPALKDLRYERLGNVQAFISFGEDFLELWTLVVPFYDKEETRKA